MSVSYFWDGRVVWAIYEEGGIERQEVAECIRNYKE